MSDYSDTVDLFTRLGIKFEEKEFKARRAICLIADDAKILGYKGGFVDLKFTIDGTFCHVGIYPKQKKEKEEKNESDSILW